MERAPRQMCAAIFKKKNVVGEKASKSVIIPSDFKTISFENFTLWEIVARKPDFAAVSHTHDMHRLALLIP